MATLLPPVVLKDDDDDDDEDDEISTRARFAEGMLGSPAPLSSSAQPFGRCHTLFFIT